MTATAIEPASASQDRARAAFHWTVWPVWFTPTLRARPSATESHPLVTSTIRRATRLAERRRAESGEGTNMIQPGDWQL